MSDRLTELWQVYRQSAWLDNVTRQSLTSGELVRMRKSGVRGLTSNPSIFQSAIGGSDAYDEQLARLAADGKSVEEAYWAAVVDDVTSACGVFEPVYHASDGVDGYVSIEVDPSLAHDRQATEDLARSLLDRIDRRNAMVKIPGTAECLGAIEEMVAEGYNVNVTLIFGLDRYQQVMDAYLAGLERRIANQPDADLSQVASVASFFISRVDVEVDRRLAELRSTTAQQLQGTAAIAQAKLAYEMFEDTFCGERWEALATRGARVQRPLWASTSTKDGNDPDTRYVDELIGPDTVNTMPNATLDAFIDHGTLARRIDDDVDAARRIWAALHDAGVDMNDVAVRLEREGIDKFSDAFDELLSTLAAKR